MTERQDKAELASRIQRFLFGKVPTGENIDQEMTQLQVIVQDLIALKFEDPRNRVKVAWGNGDKGVMVGTFVPNVPDSFSSLEERTAYTSNIAAAVQELTYGLQIAVSHLSASAHVPDLVKSIAQDEDDATQEE